MIFDDFFDDFLGYLSKHEEQMDVGPQEYTPSALRRLILADKRVKAGLRAEELRESMDPKAIMESMLALVAEADHTPVDELPRLKFKSDIYTTLLKKCMPDLRSLEVKEKNSDKSTLVIEVGNSKVD